MIEFKKELAEILDCEFLTDKVKTPAAKMLAKIAKEEWEAAKKQKELEEQAASLPDPVNDDDELDKEFIMSNSEGVELTSIREIRESLSGCEKEARLRGFLDSMFMEIKNLSDALSFLKGDEFVDGYVKDKLIENCTILLKKAKEL